MELDLSMGGERASRSADRARPYRQGILNLEKFRRYDALITAWAMSHPRYKTATPVGVFVVEDDEKALAFLRRRGQDGNRADREVGGAGAGWPTTGEGGCSWSPNSTRTRKRCARLGLPERPPSARRCLGGRHAAAFAPEQVPSLLPAAFLKC